MATSNQDRLREFSQEIHALSLTPLWERTVKLEPGSACVAAHWPYTTLRPLLEKATHLIDKKSADRRVLVLENPSLRGSSFIANSLFTGLQIILPGEIAPSHRHTPNALRFVVEGEGAYTSINGEKIEISPGDFIVTPSWSWHDHGNHGDAPVVWMDGLDTPFTSLFGAHFRENYPEDVFPISKDSHHSEFNFSEGLLPLEFDGSNGNYENILIYPFKRIQNHLMNLLNSASSQLHPVHGLKFRYSNPTNGRYPFRTMAAFMQLLPKNFVGKNYRSTENTVFNVAQGECSISFKHKTIHLKKHDIVVVPSWEQFKFEAKMNTFIFSYSDRAAQQLLGFWRESFDDSE